MARRNPPFEIEQVKQLALVARLSPHHAESPVPVPAQHRIILSRALPAGNTIDPYRKSGQKSPLGELTWSARQAASRARIGHLDFLWQRKLAVGVGKILRRS